MKRTAIVTGASRGIGAAVAERLAREVFAVVIDYSSDAAPAETLAKLAPLERLGQPDDIAAVVAVLAGPDGAWVNGQTLRANGGVI